MPSKGSGRATGKTTKAASGKSALSARTNRKRNTTTGRDAMAAAQFGLPAQKKYRIDDPAHARNALGRVAQNGTPAEKQQVKTRVARRYPGIAVTKTTTSKGAKKK